MPRTPVLTLVAALAAALLLGQPSAAHADAPPASPLLPPQHWAVEATERLEELGLLERHFPAQRAVPLLVVARALAEGEARARAARPGLLPLVAGWRRRLHLEWSGAPRWLPLPGRERVGDTRSREKVGERVGDPRPRDAMVSRPPTPEAGAAPALGLEDRSSLSPGGGEGRGEGALPLRPLGAQLAAGLQTGSAREDSTGGSPAAGSAALHLAAPSTDPFLEAGGALALGPHLAAALRAEATPWDARLTAGEVALSAGPLALSVGRGRIAYGPGLQASPVASGLATLDRVEAYTVEPLRLPLGLGDLAADFALASLGTSPRHPYGPLLLLGQIGWRPHPRLTFRGARGYMFGGDPWSGISLGDALEGLSGLGNLAGNNVFSLALRYRLPTDGWQPLTLKIELATDDELGALLSWPGLVAGLTAPALGDLPVALGLEVVHFGPGFTVTRHDPFPWYGHGLYTGGWASGSAPLGDPLGGNGDALRGSASVDALDGMLWLCLRAHLQRRRADNLYAPQAGGRSAGVVAEAELRRGRFTLGASGAHERGGSRWRRSELRVWLGASL